MTAPVVVGVDPAHQDREPLAFAVQLAQLVDAPLIAVSAYPQHKVRSYIETPAYDRLLRRTALEALSWAAEWLPPGTRTLAVRGRSAAGALHGALAELEAGVLVLGSAHHGAVGRVVVGSVADRMLHGAGCPVAVVPREYEARAVLERIGVGFIDTPEGRAALAAGTAMAARGGAVLDVVTAMPPVVWTAPLAPVPPLDDAADRAAAERSARAAVEHFQLPVDANVTVVGEAPARALALRSCAWDLLVCGSRGYGPLRTVLLGSVSRSLSHQARCPLLVLPRDSRPALDALLPAATAAWA